MIQPTPALSERQKTRVHGETGCSFSVGHLPPLAGLEPQTSARSLVPTHGTVQIAASPLDISIEDWDDLFRAIEAKLRQAVGEKLAIQLKLGDDEKALLVQTVQASVLECVEAMSNLHTALKHERSQSA